LTGLKPDCADRLRVTSRARTANELVRPADAQYPLGQVLAVSDGRDESRRVALAVVAPGTALRDGLERIVRGNTGALIVLGCDPVVAAICSGGFELSAHFSATWLRELAKMDGAIVLDQAGEQILRAAVQLVPDPSLPTQESGTRHRTAERVARQTGFPVITVSKSMRTIAVFTGGHRYVLEDSSALLARAHQALATLERYKRRADDAASALTALEIEDRATVRDIAVAAQRLEMVGRVTSEIAGYLVELGTDGGLLSLQLEELVAGTDQERALLLRDYAPPELGEYPQQMPGDYPQQMPGGHPQQMPGGHPQQMPGDYPQRMPGADEADDLAGLQADELLDLAAIAAAIGLGAADGLDQRVSARGYRLLRRIPRLPPAAADLVVEHFGSLQKLLSASAHDLQRVRGLDQRLATSLREGLARLAESALLDRYP
jgi:diadenylate cyclase